MQLFSENPSSKHMQEKRIILWVSVKLNEKLVYLLGLNYFYRCIGRIVFSEYKFSIF